MDMFVKFYVLFLAASPVLAAVVKEQVESCSLSEFSCGDGTCISSDRICDGQPNCIDGADEKACDISLNDFLADGPVLHRTKRQRRNCWKNQWRCRDGTCINFDGKCDGNVDCPDGSDETFPLCREMRCQSNWFRCTYGACVDGTAPCNGQKECADNSDELLPRCLNETDEIGGKFKCADGQLIPSSNRCDGIADCADGSDETVRACAAIVCPAYLFQCAYGACVDSGADCNKKAECADGSDESDELCNRISDGDLTVIPTGACVIPPHPEHGKYTVMPNAKPGQRVAYATINVTCMPGYGLIGSQSAFCYNGTWSTGATLPSCIRFCPLIRQPGVEYRCALTDAYTQGTRDCNSAEPDGTTIIVSCKKPNYYNIGVLKDMRCVDGSWDSTPTCMEECGTVSPVGHELVIGGDSAQHGELPWHAGIYTKTVTPFMQICGGSLISKTLVISAAHCFWNDVDKLLSPSKFAVALGKIYRPWNNPMDIYAQKSDVSDIKIPDNYDGSAANFQDDIAVVILSVQIEYRPYTKPVCVDMDSNFDIRQLQTDSLGKVAGWGITSETGTASQVLKVVQLPFVPIQECKTRIPPHFRAFITSDKICAGYTNGTALCKGDSGGGLVFPDLDRSVERYYLRGIVSTAPNNELNCNAHALTTFTRIIAHERFINEQLSRYKF